MSKMHRAFERDGGLCVKREDVEKMFASVKLDSGPGHPWILLGSTKKHIIENFKELLIDSTIETIEKWSLTPRGSLAEDPVELVRQGFAAPLRTFVKNEPHGRDKIESGRVRLILTVPIHMVLAEMLIFGPQNLEEIAHWDEIPSKPGMSLAEPKQIAKIWDDVQKHMENGVSEADVSGFDWCLTDEMFKLDAKRRVELIEGGATEAFKNAVFNHHHVICRSVIALSDGRMYKQLTPGIMKSGSYCTSSSNSFIRVMLAHAIGSTWCIAMGDDSLEATVENAEEKYGRLGIKIKYITKVVRAFEFCSHTFIDGTAWPAKPGKMFYNILNQRGPENHIFQCYQQWCFEMGEHPDFDLWDEALSRSGWGAQRFAKQTNNVSQKQTQW